MQCCPNLIYNILAQALKNVFFFNNFVVGHDLANLTEAATTLEYNAQMLYHEYISRKKTALTQTRNR